jgi:hypothetical protein
VQSNFKNTYQTLHPIFSLKKENQEKLAKAFSLLGHIIDSTIDVHNSPFAPFSPSP